MSTDSSNIPKGTYTVDDLPEFDETILFPDEADFVCPVHTSPLNEFHVRDFCLENDITCYLPLKRVLKIHQVKAKGKPYTYSKEVLRPMFASYVFVRLTQSQRSLLWESSRITGVLTPECREDFLQDIRAVRALELVGMKQELEFNTDIAEGDRFIIESGVWNGVTGYLKKKARHFEWIVELKFVKQRVRTTIDPTKFIMSRITKRA